jgi:cold shock CspA family protein
LTATPSEARFQGVVDSFDQAAGTGMVAGDAGRRFFFHCTAIADGTRSIEAGTAVTFEVRPGHLGRWEAADLRPA